MATFHVFGAAGNELLWRAFAWLAAQEAAAARSDPRAAAAPGCYTGWLDAALKHSEAMTQRYSDLQKLYFDVRQNQGRI